MSDLTLSENVIVDEEFRSILPVLSKEAYAMLEEGIVEQGCRDPLVLWNGILIDGYTRYRICQEHGIPFRTVSREFASREQALIWIITNQVSRRNLSPIQLSHFRGLHYRADKKIISNEGGRNQYSLVDGQNDHQPNSTARRLATQYRVSPKTIRRDAGVSLAIDAIGATSPDLKAKILSGEVSINKSDLGALASGSQAEVEAAAAAIEGGVYEKKAPAKQGAAVGSKVPAGSVPAELRDFDEGVHDLTDGFYSALQNLYKSGGGAAEARVALRSYIDALEGLYGKLR